MTKAVIFDTGSLITLSMNGLLYILEELKKNFNGEFIITKEVKYEIIDRPINIPRFELGAMRINNLLERGVLVLPSKLGVSEKEIKSQTDIILKEANSAIKVDNTFVKILSAGEVSCLALSKILHKKGIESIIVVDERTTRVIVEKPENLEKIISKKMHKQAFLIKKDLTPYPNVKIIRSSELVYVAYKKGFLQIKGKQALQAALYATKYKGCAISHDEIRVLKKL